MEAGVYISVGESDKCVGEVGGYNPFWGTCATRRVRYDESKFHHKIFK